MRILLLSLRIAMKYKFSFFFEHIDRNNYSKTFIIF